MEIDYYSPPTKRQKQWHSTPTFNDTIALQPMYLERKEESISISSRNQMSSWFTPQSTFPLQTQSNFNISETNAPNLPQYWSECKTSAPCVDTITTRYFKIHSSILFLNSLILLFILILRILKIVQTPSTNIAFITTNRTHPNHSGLCL